MFSLFLGRPLEDTKRRMLQRKLGRVRRKQSSKRSGRSMLLRDLGSQAREHRSRGLCAPQLQTSVIKHHGAAWRSMGHTSKVDYETTALGERVAAGAKQEAELEAALADIEAFEHQTALGTKAYGGLGFRISNCRLAPSEAQELEPF